MKLKIDHHNYLDIRQFFVKFPWLRNLMIITGRGTGKSSSARSLIKDSQNLSSAETYCIEWMKDIVQSGFVSGGIFRCAWIRNTEKAIKQSVVNKFANLFEGIFDDKKKPIWKVKADGVYYKDESLPRILFIGLNTPWNYLDNNLCCRLIVHDEIIDYDIGLDGQEKLNVQKNFVKNYTDIFQGITRPYHRCDDERDEPILIMLGNPRQAQTDLYELWQCDFNWDYANKKDIFILHKKFKFIGMWLSKFRLKEMEYKLGTISDIGNNYPIMRENDKRVIFFYRVKKLFKPEFGITFNNVNYAIDRNFSWNEINFCYIKELENHLDYPDLNFYCFNWIDKKPHNIWSRDFFSQFKSFYKRSAILYSSCFGEEQLKQLWVAIIQVIKD